MSVKFKSIPEMYEKEKSGIKPNTIRKIEGFDERFNKLVSGECKTIVIENKETGEKFFREITDVSIWNDLFIISWKHKKE